MPYRGRAISWMSRGEQTHEHPSVARLPVEAGDCYIAKTLTTLDYKSERLELADLRADNNMCKRGRSRSDAGRTVLYGRKGNGLLVCEL